MFSHQNSMKLITINGGCDYFLKKKIGPHVTDVLNRRGWLIWNNRAELIPLVFLSLCEDRTFITELIKN